MRGDREEKKAEDILKAQGYQTFRVKRMCIKVRGFWRLIGNDIFNVFDILAMNDKEVLLVSVKRGYPSREHKELFMKIICPPNVRCEIWKIQLRNRKEPFKIYTPTTIFEQGMKIDAITI